MKKCTQKPAKRKDEELVDQPRCPTCKRRLLEKKSGRTGNPIRRCPNPCCPENFIQGQSNRRDRKGKEIMDKLRKALPTLHKKIKERLKPD